MSLERILKIIDTAPQELKDDCVIQPVDIWGDYFQGERPMSETATANGCQKVPFMPTYAEVMEHNARVEEESRCPGNLRATDQKPTGDMHARPQSEDMDGDTSSSG